MRGVQGKAVCAAVFRVFGPQLAEVPLVATRLYARRQGHARVLMSAFEGLFHDLGVAAMCLPAAQSTVDTWKLGFGFLAMPEERLQATRSELRLLIFPGTLTCFATVTDISPCGVHVPITIAPGLGNM
jgi:N-acetylglutamate synthase-like GNAT family acetyltransferase